MDAACPVCAENRKNCALAALAAAPVTLVADGGTLSSASNGVTLGTGTYYVNSSVTISNSAAGGGRCS